MYTRHVNYIYRNIHKNVQKKMFQKNGINVRTLTEFYGYRHEKDSIRDSISFCQPDIFKYSLQENKFTKDEVNKYKQDISKHINRLERRKDSYIKRYDYLMAGIILMGQSIGGVYASICIIQPELSTVNAIIATPIILIISSVGYMGYKMVYKSVSSDLLKEYKKMEKDINDKDINDENSD